MAGMVDLYISVEFVHFCMAQKHNGSYLRILCFSALTPSVTDSLFYFSIVWYIYKNSYALSIKLKQKNFDLFLFILHIAHIVLDIFCSRSLYYLAFSSVHSLAWKKKKKTVYKVSLKIVCETVFVFICLIFSHINYKVMLLQFICCLKWKYYHFSMWLINMKKYAAKLQNFNRF